MQTDSCQSLADYRDNKVTQPALKSARVLRMWKLDSVGKNQKKDPRVWVIQRNIPWVRFTQCNSPRVWVTQCKSPRVWVTQCKSPRVRFIQCKSPRVWVTQ